MRNYIRSGHLVIVGTVAERFWAKVRRSEGCWEWQAKRFGNGYGGFGVDKIRSSVLAHRLAYELSYGPIPEGLDVCHTCDNPPCVRPDHLFLGTKKENMRDCVRKGRIGRWQAYKTHCKHGHEFDAENTKITKRGRRRCRACDRIANTIYRQRQREAAA